MNVMKCSIALIVLAMSSTVRANELSGTGWILVTLNGQAPLADSTLTLSFAADGRVSGNDGCNTFGGEYSCKAPKLTFGSMMSTLMAGPAPIMNQATAYQAALAKTKSMAIFEGMLSFLDEAGAELATFKPQLSKLAKTSWIVTGYNNGKQAVVSVIIGTELTLNFDASNRVSGTAGCNSFFGTYKQEGTTVAIGPLATTRMMCSDPAGVMEQEAAYLTALQASTTCQLHGSALTLRTAEDAMAVTAVPK